jgi:hypothetical protein
MKTGYLFLLILIYTAILLNYYPKKRSYHKKFNKTFPKFFSSENLKARTVTKLPEQRNTTSKGNEMQIPNSKFKYNPSPFLIDDTEELRKESISCQPSTFGYSVYRGDQIFPHHGYPKCSEINKQNDTYLKIDRSKNLLFMTCPKNKNHELIYGPIDNRKLIKRKEGHVGWEVKTYKNPINAKNLEFGLGSCEDDDEKFMQAYMTPIFNESAYNKAKSKVEKRPKIIYILTLDSLSRRHFFRKTPSIVDYLNSLNKNSNYSVFDFKLHNNMGETSPKNQISIFSGSNEYKELNIKNKNQDMLGKKALWNMLRDKGYINLVAFEDCDGSFVDYIGRYPDVEYSVNPFYCAVEKFSSSSFRKTSSEQRCIGPFMSHYYILNYTNDVVRMNQGVNMMLYVHLSAAHEYTGNHAETLNEDIRDHLDDFLKTFGQDNDIVVFLQADHGMRYGDFFRDLDAYQENKLPGFFLIASKRLLDQVEFSYHSLETNTKRLVSKLDYRKTILELEGLQDNNPRSVNLMSQIVSRNRLCEDMGIRPWDCACLKMQEIKNPDRKVNKLIEGLKSYAEQIINTESYSFFKYPSGSVCKQVVLGEISKIYHTGVSNVQELFKLEIETVDSKKAKFQVTFILTSDGEFTDASRRRYRVEPLSFKRYPLKTRILSISRLDSYAGPCEIIANEKGIRPELCLCKDYY